MPKINYVPKRFGAERRATIDKANDIIKEYEAQGFNLTLRQLYYQFVSRDLIPNNQKAYDRLGDAISDGRLAGAIDWNSIVDRTRSVRRRNHWTSPSEIIEASAAQYHVDLWEDQTNRPEVWIEKDALVGVIEDVCHELDVPHFSCRGYTSQSEMWSAAQRLLKYARHDQIPLIIHLGDHDPSGIDMTRDIEDRLRLFMEHHGVPGPLVKRAALNMQQVVEFSPPPNPAKLSDARAAKYVKKFGDSSWELDALDPLLLVELVRDEVTDVRDDNRWAERLALREEGRTQLKEVADNWESLLDCLKAPSPEKR